ncbi:MAG: hypothetical protein GQ547_04490 [Methylophaga sp.]|nr:hypothetical protein [Methylophaga sp.]
MKEDSLRKSSRRENTRRNRERRVVLHEFGSEEWLAMIKELYFFWPKKDQRVEARREKDRREDERRQDNSGRSFLQKQLTKTVERLTEEEMQVLNGLWTS